jgi:hypothetical protein
MNKFHGIHQNPVCDSETFDSFSLWKEREGGGVDQNQNRRKASLREFLFSRESGDRKWYSGHQPAISGQAGDAVFLLL